MSDTRQLLSRIAGLLLYIFNLVANNLPLLNSSCIFTYSVTVLVLENVEVPETIRDALTELFSKMFLKANIEQDEYLKRKNFNI